MKYAEETIIKEVLRLEKRQTKISELMSRSPAIEFIELQQEFKTRLDSGEDRMSKEFIAWVNIAAKKESKLKLEMKNDRKKQEKLMDEQCLNITRLKELNNALYILGVRRRLSA